MNKRYDELMQSKFKDVRIPVVRSSVPLISESDYKVGFIKRYFAQKSNDDSSPIIEISKQTFSSLNLSPHYRTTSIRWKISGPINTIGNTVGIRESNTLSIKNGCKVLPSLKMYLLNPLQFSKQ